MSDTLWNGKYGFVQILETRYGNLSLDIHTEKFRVFIEFDKKYFEQVRDEAKKWLIREQNSTKSVLNGKRTMTIRRNKLHSNNFIVGHVDNEMSIDGDAVMNIYYDNDGCIMSIDM